MPYIYNSWSLKEFKDELEKNNQYARVKSMITSQAWVLYQHPVAIVYVPD